MATRKNWWLSSFVLFFYIEQQPLSTHFCKGNLDRANPHPNNCSLIQTESIWLANVCKLTVKFINADRLKTHCNQSQSVCCNEGHSPVTRLFAPGDSTHLVACCLYSCHIPMKKKACRAPTVCRFAVISPFCINYFAKLLFQICELVANNKITSTLHTITIQPPCRGLQLLLSLVWL